MQPNFENTFELGSGGGGITFLPGSIMLWGFFGFMLIVFAVYTFILLWHWKEYSTGHLTTARNMSLYLGVSGGLFVTMAGAALWYTLI
jgi:hypothetical protein